MDVCLWLCAAWCSERALSGRKDYDMDSQREGCEGWGHGGFMDFVSHSPVGVGCSCFTGLKHISESVGMGTNGYSPLWWRWEESL